MSKRGVCAATGEPIEPGQAYVGVLLAREGVEAMERLDYSATAWEQGVEIPAGTAVVGFWKSVRHEDTDKRRHVIDDRDAVDLFCRLTDPEQSLDGSDAPDDSAPSLEKSEALRYVLTLLLVRKRLIEPVGRQGDVTTYQATKAGVRALGFDSPDDRQFDVAEPKISAQVLDDVAGQLSAMLGDEAS